MNALQLAAGHFAIERQKRLIMVCPLAFGEVGVKDRVKSVLNYKKPALWIIIAAAAVLVIMAICFLTNPTEEYQIGDTIPDEGSDLLSEQTPDEESSLSSELPPDDEDVKQQETLNDMQVSSVSTDSGLVTISSEDATILRDILESGEWNEGTGDCIDNCELVFDGNTVRYHSGCGTFNDSVYVRSISLSEEDKAEVNAILEKYISLQEYGMPVENGSMQDIILYEQPEADKVCIKVQPSMISNRTYYYYIPTGKDQEWLSEQVETLDLEGKPFDRRWEGHKERGWQIIYNDIAIRAFEGGYLYYTYDDEDGIMECFIEAPKLCDYIQLMLMEKAGYQNYDVSKIKDIVSAKLDVKSSLTGGKFYSQTITDAETLQKFEDWFSNAEYIYFGTECGTQCACMELTLANGDVVRLSMATDSCPNFHIDGVAYDYRPTSDWNNSEFYKCFDEIPTLY